MYLKKSAIFVKNYLLMELLPDFSNFITTILSIIFWCLAFIQLFWALFFFLRISLHKDMISTNPLPPVSIVIAARNEGDNLVQLLPLILDQAYENFEVILVNHQSTDDTELILKAFLQKYDHLRLIEIERSKHLNSGKKLPLTVGIKGAKYDHILLTDADCKPDSRMWLKRMSHQFSPKKELVLGYAPYQKLPGFLNRIIRFDTTMIALNYLSFAKARVPFMGVGRNIAYTKELFLKNKGFKSHYSLQSGDDDLFVQEVAKKKNYTICLSPETFCVSEPKKTWKDWLTQKTRHYTTSNRYPLFKKLLLGIYPLSLILLYISFVTLLINDWLCWISIGVFAFAILIKWIVMGFAFKRLKQSRFNWTILIWDLFYAILTPIIFYSTDQATEKKWK